MEEIEDMVILLADALINIKFALEAENEILREKLHLMHVNYTLPRRIITRFEGMGLMPDPIQLYRRVRDKLRVQRETASSVVFRPIAKVPANRAVAQKNTSTQTIELNAEEDQHPLKIEPNLKDTEKPKSWAEQMEQENGDVLDLRTSPLPPLILPSKSPPNPTKREILEKQYQPNRPQIFERTTKQGNEFKISGRPIKVTTPLLRCATCRGTRGRHSPTCPRKK